MSSSFGQAAQLQVQGNTPDTYRIKLNWPVHGIGGHLVEVLAIFLATRLRAGRQAGQ